MWSFGSGIFSASYAESVLTLLIKLAEILEVTFQQVQNYENGKTRLNTDKLQILCNALNISESHLLSDVSEHQYQLSSSESSLIDSFRAIKSEEKKECVVILVEALKKQKK